MDQLFGPVVSMICPKEQQHSLVFFGSQLENLCTSLGGTFHVVLPYFVIDLSFSCHNCNKNV